ncbi:MAG: alpha/beta hydrolase [Paraglaciecola sp.]|uniref:alpha/beta hydrolase n=1 Tax=Paraglaciecola sp. TaxID=1920173 RepID=UPI0032968842
MDKINTVCTSNNQISDGLLPEIITFLDTMAERAKPFPDAKSISPAQARENAEIVRHYFTSDAPDMAKVEEFDIPYDGDFIKIRVYHPSITTASPAFFYLHGGGWVLFSLDTHDRVMREYALRSNVCVIGIDYSLAPEFKYPYQINEIVHVILWCKQHANKIGISAEKMILGGDSAGANLSTASCLKLISDGFLDTIKGLVLNYGAFDASIVNRKTASLNSDEILLTSEQMIWFWEAYLGDNKLAKEPLVSPLLAELSCLPPVFMAISEFDILLKENIAMRDKLMASKVDVEANIYQGTIHGFLESIRYGGVAEQAFQDTSAWLQHHFSSIESD